MMNRNRIFYLIFLGRLFLNLVVARGQDGDVSAYIGNVSATQGGNYDHIAIMWKGNLQFSDQAFHVWRSDIGYITSYPGHQPEWDSVYGEWMFVDESCESNKTYFYKVELGVFNRGHWSRTASSDIVSGWRGIPAAPTILLATDGSYTNRIHISWNSSSWATSYEVWRHTAEDTGAAIRISNPELSALSFDDTNVVEGVVYYYWVKSRLGSYASGFSDSDSGYAELASAPVAPESLSASDGTFFDRIRVSWSAVIGATSYGIWRDTSDSGGAATLLNDDVTGVYFDDTNAIPGIGYHYWVNAKNNYGASDLQGPVLGFADYLATTYYVDSSCADDNGSGTNWMDAKRSIQAAIDLSVDGDTIIVTNGVYSPINAYKRIIIRSVNGPDLTTIDGNGITRCASLATNTVLSGFTLVNGRSPRGGGSYNGILNNCVLTGNTAYYDSGFSEGGGAYGSMLINCTLSGNIAKSGGGVFLGVLENCTLVGNSARYDGLWGNGGGAHSSVLRNCSLYGNTAGNGGGVYSSTLDGCRLGNCTAEYNGGGSNGGRLVNCTLSGNRAYSGGGAYYSGLENCVLRNNRANTGGGVYGFGVDNCTVVHNSAFDGGGVRLSTVRNSIVWGNEANVSYSNCYQSSLLYSCSESLQPGDGNIAGDPAFIDAISGDYRLRVGSLCIDAGTNSYVTGELDAAGTPRILDGTVDMGAYEGGYVQVTFDEGNGSVPDPNTKWVACGAPYGTLPITLRTGYVFSGWWTAQEEKEICISPESSVASVEDHTLHAKWRPSCYTITFDAQGGAPPTPFSSEVSYESIYGHLAVTTRDNYVFAGWWTGPEGTGAHIYTNTPVTITGSLVLYAYWIPEPFAVSSEWFLDIIGVTSAVQVVSDNSGDGGESIKIGGIGLLDDGEMAGLEWTVTGLGVLSFDWKVSSEAEWDVLSFYEVGSDSTNFISGTAGTWTNVRYEVGGESNTTHTFRWEYARDSVGDYVGEDAGWLDAISWQPSYFLTVNHGNGGGWHTSSDEIVISANDAITHYEFEQWIGDVNFVADVFSSSTIATNLSRDAAVTATYRQSLYELAVDNGSGSGWYPYESVVDVVASNVVGKRFNRWVGDSSIVETVDSATTTVSTLDYEMSIAATYSVPLTVISGRGTGWYPEGSLVTIVSNDDPLYMEFAVWIGDAVEWLSDESSSTSLFTVPSFPATLTATYQDSIARVSGSYGRLYTKYGYQAGISIDNGADSPSGTAAVRFGGAGVVPDNAFAGFNTEVYGSGTITFWWKTSSESNSDYLKFKVDGAEVATISGTKVPWTWVSNRVEGVGVNHTLAWEYAKNESLSSSDDSAWVDDIVWLGDVSVPNIIPDIKGLVSVGNNYVFSFLGERGIPYSVVSNATLDASPWGKVESGTTLLVEETNGVFLYNIIIPPPEGTRHGFYRIKGGD